VEASATRRTDKLAFAHARFAAVALSIYVAAAVGALSLLLATVITDKSHNDEQAAQQLLLETDVVAHRFADHLSLLMEELARLGVRSEVNLLDQNLEPERELLDMAHQDSLLFNLGVAILDHDGKALWAEPRGFVPGNAPSVGEKPWFLDVKDRLATRVVAPGATKSVLYIVSPIVRDRRFTGAFIGGVNLTVEHPVLTALPSEPYVKTFLATQRGTVVHPSPPLPFAKTADWFSLFQRSSMTAFTAERVLDGTPSIVAMAPIAPGDLILVNIARESDLLSEGTRRFWTRMLFGVFLALTPMLAIVVVFQRSLAQFRKSETEAVREEHLRSIGEAANVIAHEVRNSLNGIRMGVDLLMSKKHSPSERVVTELRAEIERLATFTHQLMLFAKNPTPRGSPIDLGQMVPKWLSLIRDVAAENGVDVELTGESTPLVVSADPTLLQIVVHNLVSNALDAVAGVNPPRILVTLLAGKDTAEVRVQDNGPGVSPDLDGRLFEPFVSGKPSGVGMGLSISKKIAVAHGGDLVLLPEHPGALFVLTLPLVKT
jgi:two-component system C4-dicarboxylate transport sensor histidine kinase DctB